MTTLETLATITDDGKLIANAPAGLLPGLHRVTMTIEERVVAPASAPTASREYFKGRPVYTEEDRRQRDCPLPPEPEWEAEWKMWEAEQKHE